MFPMITARSRRARDSQASDADSYSVVCFTVSARKRRCASGRSVAAAAGFANALLLLDAVEGDLGQYHILATVCCSRDAVDLDRNLDVGSIDWR